MSRMRFTFRLLAAVGVACALATAAHAARVGVLSNKLAAATAADFGAKIPSHTFTGIDISAGVPALDVLLADYDVLLLYEDGVFVNATAVGNRVAEFASSGRTVVLGTFYDQDRSDATVAPPCERKCHRTQRHRRRVFPRRDDVEPERAADAQRHE